MANRTPRWVRVRDRATGHEYDISPRAMRAKHQPLNSDRWPDLFGAGSRPRRPKHYVGKDGAAARKPRTPRNQQPASPAEQNGAPQ